MISITRRVFNWCQRNSIDLFSTRLPYAKADEMMKELGLGPQQIYTATCSIRKSDKYRRLAMKPNQITQDQANELWKKLLPYPRIVDELRALGRIMKSPIAEKRFLNQVIERELEIGKAPYIVEGTMNSFAIDGIKKIRCTALDIAFLAFLKEHYKEDPLWVTIGNLLDPLKAHSKAESIARIFKFRVYEAPITPETFKTTLKTLGHLGEKVHYWLKMSGEHKAYHQAFEESEIRNVICFVMVKKGSYGFALEIWKRRN